MAAIVPHDPRQRQPRPSPDRARRGWSGRTSRTAYPLVPKLQLGNTASAKLCFAPLRQVGEAELRATAVPSRAWDRGRARLPLAELLRNTQQFGPRAALPATGAAQVVLWLGVYVPSFPRFTLGPGARNYPGAPPGPAPRVPEPFACPRIRHPYFERGSRHDRRGPLARLRSPSQVRSCLALLVPLCGVCIRVWVSYFSLVPAALRPPLGNAGEYQMRENIRHPYFKRGSRRDRPRSFPRLHCPRQVRSRSGLLAPSTEWATEYGCLISSSLSCHELRVGGGEKGGWMNGEG